MSKLFQTESTLTDRYQTTIPEPIREILHLGKRDKIAYLIDKKGKVSISRASEEDPDLSQFLSFLMQDIKSNPSHVQAISPELIKRMQALIEDDIEIDLEVPLSEKDD